MNSSFVNQTSYLEKLPEGAIIDKRLYAEVSKSNQDHVVIHWSNPNGLMGLVFVVGDDGQEKLFAAGKLGKESEEVSWIQNGKKYEFNLYEDAEKLKPLVKLFLVKSSTALRQSAFNIS